MIKKIQRYWYYMSLVAYIEEEASWEHACTYGMEDYYARFLKRLKNVRRYRN